MAEIPSVELPILPLTPSNRVEKDAGQGGGRRKPSPGRPSHEKPDQDDQPPSPEDTPSPDDSKINIVAAPVAPSRPSAGAVNCQEEIRQASLLLARLSEEMIQKDWTAYDSWAAEMVRLEQTMHRWLLTIRQDCAQNGAREEIHAALQEFNRQLKTFTDLFTTNLLFLRGVLNVMGLTGQGYDAKGQPVVSPAGVTLFNFKEEK